MPNRTDLENKSNIFNSIPGEMANCICNYDWENTSLGAIANWSSSLINTINLMLYSKFPMFLLWGDEYIQFYNDAYAESLGSSKMHPKSLGQKGVDCWKESWDTVKAQIDEVINTGNSSWKEDQKVSIYNGERTFDTYWTYSYSKIVDLDGGLGGLLVICNEATAKVDFERQMHETVKNLAENEARLRFMLEDAPIAIAILAGEDLIIESANNKMLEVWSKDKSVLGKKVSIQLPEMVDQGFIDVLKQVFTKGESFYGNEVKAIFGEADKREEVYANFVFHPLKGVDGLATHVMVIANIITEQVLARQKVEDAEEMLRLSIEGANVGTWVLNFDTKEITCSDRLVEMFGLSPNEEITFEKLLSCVPGSYVDKIREHIELSINNGSDYVLEHPIVTTNSNQPERWVRALGKTNIDEFSNSKIFSGIMIDITEQKLDGQRKNDFIGMVSHELKTPLTSLSAYAQLLHAKSVKNNDTFTTEILNKVNHQVRKMSQLINGFLNVSRLESGKIILEKNSFDLIKLINLVKDEFLITSSTNKIEILAPETKFIYADHDKIVSVVNNLLSNAIKYSSAGSGIVIKVIDEVERIVVSVKDQGSGIKKEDLKKLFDRFYRSESNITKHISGFGIGLYLSAEIIQRHDGQIWVESEEGSGSTFYFAIPLKEI